MDDPNITMEEYIRLEEEKAHRRVFNDTLTSEVALSCEPMVSSLNDEIDFRISFDESDDEDCTVIFDKNSFSYKIISVNNLKTNSENDNDKVNMPLLPSPKPTVSYFDDLDYFKDFEKEFPAIVYNDAQTSKSDLLTEPILNPQHIDEFNLKDETSLSECDEEEQNVLNFNDLFPFNVIYPDELKTDTDNDNDKVDIEHSSGDLSVKPLPDVINTDVGAYAHGYRPCLVKVVKYGNDWEVDVYGKRQHNKQEELFTHKEEMDLETVQTTTTAKLPILKQGKYDIWRLRIEQYFFKYKTCSIGCHRNGITHSISTQQQQNADGTVNFLNTRGGGGRNKPNLDTMSFDDLYNNFKIVEQEVKGTTSSSSSSSSQNMAFVPASTQVSTASTQVSTANLSDDTVYAFLASQPNGSQLVYEDLEQIHEDDIEEMDLKWQLALLSMRTRSTAGTKVNADGLKLLKELLLSEG
ncbi:hypothetical protein Tco_1003799 [Tanacetum coccineum]|uniref:Uncharacterized protein n=1 Tax=Tanacetum coccineum TaxID=301880 RepID=A0ABQ5FAH5_9ASTR